MSTESRREIKPQERHVALTPGATGHLTAPDHAVLAEPVLAPPGRGPEADLMTEGLSP